MKLSRTRSLWLGLALSVAVGSALAGGPFPFMQMGFPNAPEGGSWQFPPMRQQSPGMHPPSRPASNYNYNYGYGSSPPPRAPQQGWGYGQVQGQPQASQSTPPPRIEETLSSSQPYAQESLIYTLRIVSDENLKTVDVTLPTSDAVIFKRLDGPIPRIRTGRGGRQEVVNEFHYILTPLRAGSVSLAPIAIRGTYAGGYGPSRSQEFQIRGSHTLQLQVKPMAPGVQPWLPLQHLALRTEVQGAEELAPGKPFRLLVEMFAVGTTGSQLPSLERQLSSPQFRVYREQTQTSEELTPDGRYLQGTRKESFTLVPQQGGKLHLPELRIAWWNVNTGNVQYASVPTQPLGSSGLFSAARYALTEGTFFPAGSSSVFWIPVAGIFGLLIGYWLAVGLRSRNGEEAGPSPLAPLLLRLQVWAGLLWRRFGPALGRLQEPTAAAAKSLVPAFGEIGHQFGAMLHKVSPGPYWRRFSNALVQKLPRSLRFWFCVRSAAKQAEPDAWWRYVKANGAGHLGLSPQPPLARIGEAVIAVQHNADPDRVRALIRKLDGAIYGGESLDFARWKRDFAQQVRPRLSLGRRGSRTRRGGLPDLNPIAA